MNANFTTPTLIAPCGINRRLVEPMEEIRTHVLVVGVRDVQIEILYHVPDQEL